MRKESTRVVVPEKSSAKSQYIEKEKIRMANAKRDERLKHKKKKFINVNHMAKKFNGVMVGSDSYLEGNNSLTVTNQQ